MMSLMVGSPPASVNDAPGDRMQTAPHPLRIGPAGWSYADWEGLVYPPGAGRGLDRLQWIARFFDLVEVNASFYRVPTARMSAGWVERTQGRPGLVFATKLHQGFTHAPGPWGEREARAFDEYLSPLHEAGRLGPLLAQFPWGFRPGEDALDRLHRLRDRFGRHELVLELRHGHWAQPRWQEALAGLGLPVAAVDQPAVGPSLQLGDALGPPFYVRLHGRNRAAWASRDAGRDQRYDHLYGEAELDELAAAIAAFRREGPVHVVTNNHFRGKAVVNALELRALLDLPPQELPAWLLDEYPRLARRLPAARPLRGAGPQPDLF